MLFGRTNTTKSFCIVTVVLSSPEPYGPSAMALQLWPFSYGPSPMALQLWPFIYGPFLRKIGNTGNSFYMSASEAYYFYILLELVRNNPPTTVSRLIGFLHHAVVCFTTHTHTLIYLYMPRKIPNVYLVERYFLQLRVVNCKQWTSMQLCLFLSFLSFESTVLPPHTKKKLSSGPQRSFLLSDHTLYLLLKYPPALKDNSPHCLRHQKTMSSRPRVKHKKLNHIFQKGNWLIIENIN